ncbi:glycosyl hydrolase [Termitidicoccus mucosus]|uniref:Glycoside hydrolase n=1 Tax=Termitidicoccus mucosus TaxID=1184151 RepID=A0A178IPL1_9BACT|nr:hypothetical protein AW736_01210 [Opitutaceae bacterium TSB47]
MKTSPIITRLLPAALRILSAFLISALQPFSLSALFSASADLESGFASPPLSARPLGWWHWANGNVTKEGIDADLEAMKRAGMGGVQMFDVEIYMPPGPVRYGTENWFDHVTHAIRKADALGLEFHLMNTPGWSASGGPWVTEALSMKRVVWTETDTAGGEISLALPRPDTKPFYAARTVAKAKNGFYQDIAVFAVPVTGERLAAPLDRKIAWASKPVTRPVADRPGIPAARVIDLTAHMDAAGKLAATLPPGEWTLLRFGFVSTGKTNHPAVPEGHGLEIDKLDADAVAFQFERAVLPLIRKAGPLAGKTFTGLLFDSFEGGFQNWTAKLPEAFAKQKGYDFLPWLPLLTGRIIESEAASEAVLWDFRHVIEEMLAENYFGTMHRLAARHGIKLYSESQGGPLNPMSANRHVDVPMNEFWTPELSGRASRIKQSVSSASFLGRRVVAAEAFTSTPEFGKFQNTPASLKRVGDQAFALGLNRFAFHSWTHQPVTDAAPGFALGRYGVHFGRLNTWWPYADAWIAYLARSQFLLQQGRIAADICLLVDEDLGYGLPASASTLAPGHDYEVCYPADLHQMTVRGGVVSHPLAGDFRLLLTPGKTIAKTWVTTLPTLRQLRKLVADGAVLAGEPPSAPAGLDDLKNKAEFDRLVAEIWGGLDGKKNTSKKLGTGTVFAGRKPAQILAALKLARDVAWSPENAAVEFLHRATPDAEIYFISSQSAAPASLELEFRQRDRVPELWDAATGARAGATLFRQTENGIALPVAFEPWGSVFVVFRKPLPSRWATAVEPAAVSVTQTVAGLLSREPVEAVRYSDGTRAATGESASLPPAQTLAAPWRVTFPDGRGAPSRELVFEKLVSWPEHPDIGVKYYSGTAVYKTTFVVTADSSQRSAGMAGMSLRSEPARDSRDIADRNVRAPVTTVAPSVAVAPVAVPTPHQRAFLDLGAVADIARVYVNGRDAGILWKPPFRADITALLQPGENTLEIHVANRWINRLIGDEAIDDGLSYQDTGGKNKFTDGRIQKLPDWLYDPAKRGGRKRHSFSVWKHYNADSPLVPAGLLGPVTLEWLNHITPGATP